MSAIIQKNSRTQNRARFAKVFEALMAGRRIAIRDLLMDASHILWSVLPRLDKFAPPGQPISVTLGSAVLEPFEIARALADGKVPPEVWQRQCGELGIQGLDLGEIAAAA